MESDAAPQRGRRIRVALPGVLVSVVLVGLAFDNGGYSSRAWTTASVTFLWVAALVLLLRDEVRLSRFEWTWLALLSAFFLWSGLSLVWSVDHSEPWLEVRRGLVYVGGAAAFLLVAARRSLLDVLVGVWGAIAVVVCYALARYLLAPGPPDRFQLNLLFRPVGYANALGILAGIALIVALVLAVRSPSRELRALCAASAAPLAATISLTSSRASALAFLAGLIVAVLVERERLRLVVFGAVCAPLLLIVVVACERSGLTDDVRSAGVRHRAALLAVLIVLPGVALAFAPVLAERAAQRVSRLSTRRLRRVAAIAIGLFVVVAIVAGAGRAHRFFATGARPAYWRVAWTEYIAHPALGSGAGTFADYWLRHGNSALYGGALDAHSLYLESLAEVGPIGLALLAAGVVVPFVAAAFARTDPVIPAALGGYVAFVTHAALDWDWEMPVVTLAGLACAAVLLVAARDPRRAVAPSPGTRTFLVACAVALATFALVGELAHGLGGTFG